MQLRGLDGARPVSLCKIDAYPRRVYHDHFGISLDDPDLHVGDIAEPGVVDKLIDGFDKALGALRKVGYPLAEEDVARLSPFGRRHINVIGTYTFALPDLGPGGRAGAAKSGRARVGRLTSTSTIARWSGHAEAAQHDQPPSLPSACPALQAGASSS
ncbi:hypothetical protein, partial [Nonomuraea sp. KM90]|uniref:hypothetical protein n=1 Tax=Nonomuraea sp. KM90 TaxID=3457428 RepID=UPI003FCC9FC3